MKNFRWFLLLALSGCAVPAEGPAPEGDAARLGPNRGYFLARPDPRMCPSPVCGGWWVHRVNHDVTTCVDGTTAAECYVTSLGGVDGAEGALYRGKIAEDGDFAGYGVLETSETWLPGVGTAPSGVFAREVENGIVCIASPCRTLDERKLDRGLTTSIADLDFTPSEATSAQIELALEAAGTSDGVIVAGDRYQVSGPAGTAPARTVTEFWTLVP